jgi:alcohol dehydrogenase (NADP+)
LPRSTTSTRTSTCCAATATSRWWARRKSRCPSVFGLIFNAAAFPARRSAASPETQEMLDFCGKHNITSDVEVIPIQKVNEAYERLLKSDVKYRFSIDMASLKAE